MEPGKQSLPHSCRNGLNRCLKRSYTHAQVLRTVFDIRTQVRNILSLEKGKVGPKGVL
jgi:hypothetical protein